jgi:hypothetical protein
VVTWSVAGGMSCVAQRKVRYGTSHLLFTSEKIALVHALKVAMKEEGANELHCGGIEIGDATW